MKYVNGLNIYFSYFIPNKRDSTGNFASITECRSAFFNVWGTDVEIKEKKFKCFVLPDCSDCCKRTIDNGMGGTTEGGSHTGVVVKICYQNNTKESVKQILIHELVHAIDRCQVKEEDFNCFRQACSELRAYDRDGRCDYEKDPAQYANCVQNFARRSLQFANCWGELGVTWAILESLWNGGGCKGKGNY